MGTRSLTTIRSRWSDKDEYQTHAHIYVHWDGYPSGHGANLAEFLDGMTIVNGIGSKMPDRYANGPGRFASQLVAYLQEKGSNPDLMPHTVEECGQEYHYLIDVDNFTGPITVTVFEGPMTAFGFGGADCKNVAFSGAVPEYLAWLQTANVE